ncbi:hypothetical protein ACU6YA_10290 [Klebsiella aerogenes]|nr:hypothetical protein [Klebsiella aerogenes]HDT3332856.1 hypothetical protein [Klebsiella aerogenes]HDU4031570.1 hypothetical protein [Klebsiella aerogenes]HDU5671762.1 hypothetical protein [Klebsiella aerogenes]
MKRYALFGVLLLTAFSSQATEKENNHSINEYSLRIDTNNALCIAHANDIEALSNYYQKEPIMASINVAPFLENGKNTLKLYFASLTALTGDETFPADARCQGSVSLVKNNDRRNKTKLAELIASVDDKLQPTGKLSVAYQGNTDISAVSEGPLNNTILYQVSREFTVKGLPEWTWTKATPFQATEENIKKLRAAYTEMWHLLNNKESQKIKEKYEIASQEQDLANDLPPGTWYQSLAVKKNMEKSHGAIPINWDEYELKIINHGRLVQYEDRGISPLSLKDKDGELLMSFTPYFSLINGQIIITR